jgi:hypothetical protein
VPRVVPLRSGAVQCVLHGLEELAWLQSSLAITVFTFIEDCLSVMQQRRSVTVLIKRACCSQKQEEEDSIITNGKQK